MANDVASRREARRRRILENCENRLQKISGKNDSLISDLGTEDTPTISLNGAHSEGSSNGPLLLPSSNVAEVRGDLSIFQHVSKNHIAKSYLHKANLSLQQQKTADIKEVEIEAYNPSVFDLLYTAKMHLVCLALLVRVMLIFSYDYGFGNIILPLCIVEATDVLLQLNKETNNTSPSFIRAAMLLGGISPRIVAILSSCLETLRKIAEDGCVYIFSFITFHSILMQWQRESENVS